jgi:hypothetical protein
LGLRRVGFGSLFGFRWWFGWSVASSDSRDRLVVVVHRKKERVGLGRRGERVVDLSFFLSFDYLF